MTTIHTTSPCPSWCTAHPNDLGALLHTTTVRVFGWELEIDADPEDGDRPRIVLPERETGISPDEARVLAAALIAAANVVDPQTP